MENIKISGKYQTNSQDIPSGYIHCYPSSMRVLSQINASYDPSDTLVRVGFGALLYRWMECNNHYQIVNEPTRITQFWI